jgi:hypothetical protein
MVINVTSCISHEEFVVIFTAVVMLNVQLPYMVVASML